MEKLDPIFLLVLSDLFVSLSAAWLGAAIIVPIGAKRPKLKFWLLSVNLIFAIILLTLGYQLRRSAGI